MTQRSLPFYNDYVGRFPLESLNDGCLQFACAELGGYRITCDPVASSLDQSGLAGADHHGLDPELVEYASKNRSSRAFA